MGKATLLPFPQSCLCIFYGKKDSLLALKTERVVSQQGLQLNFLNE